MQKYTWFYSLPNPLDPAFQAKLQTQFDTFSHQWKSHGAEVEGQIGILRNQFVVVRSNEQDDRPSGCSIDGMKRSVESILTAAGLSWLDAAHVFYEGDDGSVAYTHFSKISALIGEGKLTPDTLILDHTLGQSDDLSRWEVLLKDSWLKRFLPREQASL
ncbi:MAG: hypothetical protein AAGI38_11270 [Bacteroidota bacterium]